MNQQTNTYGTASGLSRVAVALAVILGIVGAAIPASAGQDPPGGSVIGGQPTTFDEHPYVATIGGCTASIVDAEWILTAAHCVDDGPVVVMFGGATVGVTGLETVIHPLWNRDVTKGHDLALVRVPSAATAGAEFVQVGDPFRRTVYRPGRLAEFVGIGLTDPDDNTTFGGLNEVAMQIRSDDEMEGIYDDWYRPWSNRYRGHLMIGAGSGSATICNGDSGGPLTTFLGQERIQVGVASFGSVECDRPSVYGELDGANLAWLASELPAIMDRWSTCSAGGRVGTPVVRYVRGNVGPRLDGAYSWDLRCRPTGPPPPPPVQEEPPICLKNPFKCDPLDER